MTPSDAGRLVAFIIATAGLMTISWRSLFNIRSHGFFRFFAWETIVALVLWNLPFWFSDPLSIRQLFSWIVLGVSVVLLWQGVTLLRTGKPVGHRAESELFAFEKTTELVTSGVYRYIRHPLYASLMYLSWGAFLKDISWSSTVLTVAAGACLVATARADERECVQYFGPQYEQYMKKTKMFIPLVF